MTIEQIAAERRLVTSTIEAHLAFYVEQGLIEISKLISPTKQKSIEQVVAKMPNTSLTEIKKALGNK